MKCDNCVIMEEINNSASACCCIWYMDNVVCGDKNVEECTEYKEKKYTESEDTE